MSECRVCGSTKTNAFLCGACAKQLDDAFEKLPGLVDDILTAMTRQARVYRSSSRRREPDPDWRGSEHALIATPLPLDLDAGDLLHRVGNELSTWARHLAESRGVDLPPMRSAAVTTHDVHVTVVRNRWRILREPRTVRAAQERTHAALVRWLLEHRDAIRHDEAAAEIHTAITRLRDDLLAAVDNAPSPLYAGPCHARVTEVRSVESDGTVYVQTLDTKCERDLYAWPGADGIRCDGYRVRESGDQGCGTAHTFAEREGWLAASVHESLVTIDELLHALPTLFPRYPQPPKTVAQAWVRQRRLQAHGLRAGGEPTYPGGQFLDLIKAYVPKREHARPNARRAS